MARNLTVRLAAVTLLLPTAVALASCGHSKNSSSGSSSSRSSSSSSSSSSQSSGNCAAGFTQGQIGGQPKCLQNGQPCQEQQASDYKKYGFECTKSGGSYTLSKK